MREERRNRRRVEKGREGQGEAERKIRKRRGGREREERLKVEEGEEEK